MGSVLLIPLPETLYHFGECTLDLDRYQLRRGQQVCELPRLAMEVLLQLVRGNGRLITRNDLATSIWPHADPADVQQSISTAINRIRQVLHDDPADPHYLQTVIGKGYRFVAPVRASATPFTPQGEPSASAPPPAGVQSAAPAASVSLEQLHAWYTAGAPVELSALRLNAATTVIAVRGALRLGPGLKMLELQLNDEVQRGTHALVLDLAAVPLMDSAGLGLLLHLLGQMQQHGHSLRLCCITDRVRELLRMTRTDSLLPIDADVPASLAALAQQPGPPSA